MSKCCALLESRFSGKESDLMMFWFIVSAVLLLFALRFRYPYFIKEATYARWIAVATVGTESIQTPLNFSLFVILQPFKNPHKAFIRFQDETYSYAQSDKQSNKIARSLLKHADLHEGDTVALLLGNEPMFLWMWLALAKIGCSAALLNHNIRSKSLVHCFTCCGATVLIAGAELQDAVEEVLPALREQGISVYILTDHVTTEGMKSLTDKIAQASDELIPADLRANITLSSPAAYIYTSGTTGRIEFSD
uniref:Long-chain-fatty-acid--CoA ligase n=1 Tax=Sinocyclocheilus anshuiensis TaxID=1608454 RepID=A0A671MHC4_9TELE